MHAVRRTQLVRQRAVAKLSLTRMQTFIETGDRKLNDIQVRSDEMPNIFNKFKLHKMNSNCQMTQIVQLTDNLKTNTLRLRQGSMNFYIRG
jgi:hypothetical protein